MNRCGQYLYETAQIMVKQNVESHDILSSSFFYVLFIIEGKKM